MQKVPVKLGSASYDVLIADNLLWESGRLVRESCGDAGRVVVITSPRVRKFWGKKLESALRTAGLRYAVVTVPDGEKHKDLRSVEKLMRRMAAAGADRSSVVVALGGGVIGDIAGFAAAIYMRGVAVVQIPTTLLAQVDASIGGKTGVNLPDGKNLVGAFHQPKIVLIDPKVLSTLSDREYRAGIFEIIKCAAIRDPELLTDIESNTKKLLDRDPALTGKAIQAAIKVKAKVVSLDEREGDLRRILNFGHTIGHALEAESKYRRFLHGEAVGWGMIAAAKIGEEVGLTPPSVATCIEDVVLRCGPLPAVTASPDSILKLIRSDKKATHGKPHFVFVTEIGKTAIANDVSVGAIRKAVSYIVRLSSKRGLR